MTFWIIVLILNQQSKSMNWYSTYAIVYFIQNVYKNAIRSYFILKGIKNDNEWLTNPEIMCRLRKLFVSNWIVHGFYFFTLRYLLSLLISSWSNKLWFVYVLIAQFHSYNQEKNNLRRDTKAAAVEDVFVLGNQF